MVNHETITKWFREPLLSKLLLDSFEVKAVALPPEISQKKGTETRKIDKDQQAVK